MLKEKETTFKNPPGYEINFDLLQQFESELDPIHPEQGKIPCRVLGYGEISTAFEIDMDTMRGLAFKRMSVFENQDELNAYLQIYITYNRLLEKDIGLGAPRHGYAIVSGHAGRPIFYIIQEKVPGYTIGNQVINYLPLEEILLLVRRVLNEQLRVFSFSQSSPIYQVGLDGQISNWIVQGFDPEKPQLHTEMSLAYLDNSTPLFRVNGIEQIDPELFLRPAPSFLTWILRMLFLKDVVNRYYDFRSVIIDLMANFYKEQKGELIPAILQEANEFILKEAQDFDLEPITEKEIHDYYREDALIWRLYLGMRRVDRSLHRLTGRYYPYILPGKTKR